MHIVMVTTGTLGDVQPFVALGLGLQRAGYRVTLATHPDYAAFATSHGLAFRSVGVPFKELLESPPGRAWVESGNNIFKYKKTLGDVFVPTGMKFFEDAHAAVLDADALLFHPFAIPALHTAEKRGLPAACVSLIPFPPSGEADPIGLPNAPRWKWLRRWASGVLGKVLWDVFGHQHRAHREKLGLPPMKGSSPILDAIVKLPTLHLYSPSLLPRPADWSPSAVVTGFCFLDAPPNWAPPEKLVDFLSSGPAPIYIGFGSMTGRDPEQVARLAVDAVTRTSQRAVLASGWAGLGQSMALPEHVFSVESIPHDWLFPRVSAVCHHGGAGTTAAGLRAGRPTFVTAFLGDQIFWGQRVARAGAGPLPITRRNLTAARLAEGITQTVSDARYREGARKMAEMLAQEDGVSNAVAEIARHFGPPRASG
jgi:sterol 3beta-glucosyltransferase